MAANAAAENQLDVLLQAVEEVVEQPEDLEGCEKLIEGSSLKNNFLRIGQALVTINDRKLYKRAGSTSFTQYIEQKSDFGFGPRQALRLLAATRLVRNFPPTIALPTSERQVRKLGGCRGMDHWVTCTCGPLFSSGLHGDAMWKSSSWLWHW